MRKVWNSPSAAKNASGRATRRTTEQETSPSFHWSPASSPTIDRWPRSDHREAVDPLAGAGVHLVRHRRRSRPGPRAKPSVTSSWPAISRIVVARLDGAGDQLDQRGDDVEVERPRVDLADAGQHPLEAEVAGDPLLELGQPRRGRRRAGRACPGRCPSDP